ncbi:hypothetical protein M422DRAFT_262045 [Sphaerobolus stellatus SS14]|uniref:F-box domain-containing protein n=1 Tax=Sphaerobolus stellatus (strain SS14) TaxID=990650 RepID=A0A0C9VDZ9_SPHS4|nr:hypothetical protein M422DRAFT_262045 [Sphaerobolus stellatus SS14]
MDALPPELFREIFLLALPILPKNLKNVPLEVAIMCRWSIISPDPLPAVHRLSSVCTLWRNIINGLLPAWSKIVGRPPDNPPLESIMDKCQNEQLDLFIKCNTVHTLHEATDDVKE